MEQSKAVQEAQRLYSYRGKWSNNSGQEFDFVFLLLQGHITTIDTSKGYRWNECEPIEIVSSDQALFIKENYTISVPHRSGYGALGSLSAGERQALAMSFTRALHSISGFDSPLLIDTPVSKVSATTEEFAKIFLGTSHEKQLELLFTPKEYYGDVENVLAPHASNIYRLDFEKSETKVEVVKNTR